MENLILETNEKLQGIVADIGAVLDEYKTKLANTEKDIENQLATVQNYKLEFFASKEKIEKMNSDIEGFEVDYQKLVDRFKDDELSNILVAASKEISAKIEERKKVIAQDRLSMNEIVKKAEDVKKKLVKLNTEKKALEIYLEKILDTHEFYSKALNQVIDYTNTHNENLSACFYDETITDLILNENNNDDFSVDELHISKDEYVIEDNTVEEEINEEEVNEEVETTITIEDEVIEDTEEDTETEEEAEDTDEVESEENNEDDETEENVENDEESDEEESTDAIELSEDEIEPVYETGDYSTTLEEVTSDDTDEDEEEINIDDINIELSTIADDEETFETKDISPDEYNLLAEDIVIDESVFDVEDTTFDEEDLTGDLDISSVAEINIDEIEDAPLKSIDDYTIEGNEHEIVVDNFPSQEIDFNNELDLENIINFSDELEDEEK